MNLSGTNQIKDESEPLGDKKEEKEIPK